MITSPEQAQHIIATGQADLVLLAANSSVIPTGRSAPLTSSSRTSTGPSNIERARL